VSHLAHLRVLTDVHAETLKGSLVTERVEGHKLLVHLWDTSESPPVFMTHNCGNAPCSIAQQRAAPVIRPQSSRNSRQAALVEQSRAQPRTSYAVQPPSYESVDGSGATSAVSSVPDQYTMVDLMNAMEASDPRRATYLAYFAQNTVQQPVQGQLQYALPSNLTYVSNTSGLPVNRSEGTVPTESRGIFIGGLHYKAHSKDITQWFKRAGNIVKCDLQKDSNTGKSKGNALIQYATATEASKAVRMFDQQVFMGMQIKVRLDKDPVPVASSRTSSTTSGGRRTSGRSKSSAQQSKPDAEPLIVNGSTCKS